MERKTGIRLGVLLGLLGMAVALFSACGGVSQEKYDALQAQVTAKNQEVASLQQQLQAAQTGAGGGQQQIATLQQQITAKEQEIADLKKAAEEAKKITPLVYTTLTGTPTPRPTATPRPPGFVAPTPVPPDDVTVNAVFPFTFYVETLTGHQVTDFAQSPSCVPNTQFRRGSHLVWRFEVFDTSTGKRVTSLDSPSASVKLVLENGQEIAARFAKKAGTGPWTWVAAWDPPMDYPLGPLDYTIVVTKGDRTGTFDPKLVDLLGAETSPTTTIDQRIQILP
ncbi:MAG: hypothetical protein HYY00_03765 [Chloroflexi bacterium]|nr:hypothetical protein [Chloroflexota bacterium]